MGIVNRLTGDCVPVQGCPPPPPEPFRLLTSSSSGRPNTAMGMPRRQLEKAESSSSEEDEVLKISAIFSGDDVNKLDAFLPKSCIAETPPPAKAETSETVEVEVKTKKKNLETEETQSCDSVEETSVSSKLDPSENTEAENNVSEQGEEEEKKPAAEYSTDSEDDLEEILADEFKEDKDSLDD